MSEQRRLVGLLDAAFAGLATATAHTQKNLQNARELFANHLDAVFARERQDWRRCELHEAVDTINTGPFGSLLHKRDYKEGGTPVVNPINLLGGEITADTSKSVDDSTRDRLASYALKDGDVIIGRRGEIGRCAVVTEREAGWLCGTGCFVIRTNGQLDPSFLCHLLRSRKSRSLLEGQSFRATMPSISNKQLAALPVSFPEITAQKAINSHICEMSETTQRLVAVATSKLAALEELKRSILQRAFRGELSAPAPGGCPGSGAAATIEAEAVA